MSSLIANFFKRNVTLNMGATVETSPQTAYSKSVGYGLTPEQMKEILKELDSNSYWDKVLGAWNGVRWEIARPEPRGVWNLPRAEYNFPPTAPCPYCLNDGIDTDGKVCKHWNGMGWTKNPPSKRYPARDFSVDISVDTSKLDAEIKKAMEKLFRNDSPEDNVGAETVGGV